MPIHHYVQGVEYRSAERDQFRDPIATNRRHRTSRIVLRPIVTRVRSLTCRNEEDSFIRPARLIGTTLGDGNVLCEGFSRNGRFSLQWAQVAR
jgi:hypothetical protein